MRARRRARATLRAMALPQIGSPAPDLSLLGPDEEEIRLSTLWRERPTVVVFLRHFG